jgi:DNA-binding MarR family transcriptional regulator
VSLLPVLRALVECHTQIERVASRELEARGLTHAQFDVLVTLGDMPGMTCGALGERTLITKGTLTPVLNRLEAKGLIRRAKSATDKRQVLISLTPAGQALYERTFLPHVQTMQPRFDILSPAEQQELIRLLHKLKGRFTQ